MTEFGFIDRIKQLCQSLPTNSFEGIGDDCAVFPINSSESLLFTSDMLIERIHFLREAISPYDLGRKSLTVNLSDIAAMGGQPTATLLSLSIPKELANSWVDDFMRGYRDLSEECGVALIGGDTTASKGDLAINVTAIGRVVTSNIKRRSAAKVGDTIFVTSPLGGSGSGLDDILRGEYTSPLARLHNSPTARIKEGVWLGGRDDVHAMMDISDGIASDLRHILKASSVGAEIELTAIPCHLGAELRHALSSGEDYELLFTAHHSEQFVNDYLTQFGVTPIPVGKIVASEDITWLSNGTVQNDDFRGFTHY